jgi:ferric-dicitrate binding protein FerR (iron transport regulator)
MEQEILIRYIGNHATPEEVKAVNDWSAADGANQKELEDLYMIIQTTERARVMRQIDVEKSLSMCKRTIKERTIKKKRIYLFQTVQRVAAVLLVPALVLSLVLATRSSANTQFVEVHSNPGVVSAFELPDGSKIWLNSGGSLRYPTDFDGDERLVELTGEAYFEVMKNPNKPFIVQASNKYSVRVLGTSFNVSAYDDDNCIETTLVEGSVELNIKGASGKLVKQLLKPNEKSYYSKKGNKLSITEVDTNFDTAWRDGELKFKATPMLKVLKALERHYNVSFDIENEEIVQSEITANFKDEQLPQVLEYLQLAAGIEYKMGKSENNEKRNIIKITTKK